MPLFIFFCGYILFSSANWVINKFGPITYEQIIFHLNMPFRSEIKLVISYLQHTFMTAAIIAFVLWLLFSQKYRLKYKPVEIVRNFIYRHRYLLSILWLLFCVVYFFIRMNVWTMLTYRQHKREISNFYELYYVVPQQTQITFSDKPRNLIIIFMESIESTFAKTPEHDYFKVDLIPELHSLANQNINFSNSEYLGGATPIDGTQWTQAGLFAKTCGAPIQLPLEEANLFQPESDFYPNAYCIYDILRQQGYNESFMIGSNGEFGGMDRFVATHGQQQFFNTLYFTRNLSRLSYKKRRKNIPDEKLFVYAKEELSRLAQDDKPFVFTFMTLDTHFGTQEFSDNLCERKYGSDNNLQNVVSCSSLQIGNFVEWIKRQPFYENTTIVLLGDHLMMNQSLTEDMERHPLNIFINTTQPAINTKNRIFTPFDIYPTIIESIGAQIDGHRLGLGTSLFADMPTLTEGKISVEDMNNEVRKSNKIYDWLLYGKQIQY